MLLIFEYLYTFLITQILSATSSLVGQKSVSGVLNFDSDDKSAIPRPDFSQMIPYKPKFNTVPGDHPIPGESM